MIDRSMQPFAEGGLAGSSEFESAAETLIRTTEAPVLLVLPFEFNLADNHSWIAEDLPEIVEYLVSRSAYIEVLNAEKLNSVSKNQTSIEELISNLANEEIIDYCFQGNLNSENGFFRLHYTIYDANTRAIFFEKEHLSDNINDLVPLLNSVSDETVSQITYVKDSLNTSIQTSFRALQYFIRGELSAETLDFQNALHMYSESIKDDPYFVKVYIRTLSLYFLNMTDVFPTLAEPFLRRAFADYEKLDDIDRILLSAYDNFYYKKYEESLSNFLSLTIRYPYFTDGYIGILKILTLLKQEQALEAALINFAGKNERFVEKIPYMKAMYEAYSELGFFQKAIDTVKKYQDRTQNSLISILDEANLLHTWGRSFDALNLYNVVLQREPYDFIALTKSAEIYYRRMDFKRSAQAFAIASANIPPEYQFRERDLNEYLFLAYIYSGQYYAAINIAERLISQGFRDSNYKNTLQIACRLTLLEQEFGKESQIIHAILSLLKLQLPDYQSAYLLALISSRSDNAVYETAFNKELESFKQLNKFQYDVLKKISTGFIAHKNGAFKEAVQSFESAQLYEYNPVIAYYISSAYYSMGNMDKANDEIEKFYANLVLNDFENAFILPYFYIIQADILESEGKTVIASEIIRNFLAMWQRGDEGLKALGNARAKLLKLNSK
ncbi:tetratricopeptide repeat protein [candidate division KSB1 bacterium]